MSELEDNPQCAEPALPGERPVQKGTGSVEEIFSALLVLGWLLLPAIQYFATVQRTGLQIGTGAMVPELTNLDLTAGYGLLLALTFGFAGIQLVRSRKSAQLKPVP